jgi:hypothetical protein
MRDVGDTFPAVHFGLRASGDDRDALRNDIALMDANAAAARSGGIIGLPAGNIRFTGNLLLDQAVTLRGAGMLATTLQMSLDESYEFLVANRVAEKNNAEYVGVESLSLDGRKDQSSGARFGIRLSASPSTAGGDSFYDPRHLVRNVRVYKAGSDGIRLDGRSGTTLDRVFVSNCDGWGIWSTFDTDLAGMQTEACRLGGVHLDNGSIRMTNVKAYLSGDGYPGSTSPGFYFGSNCKSITGAALEAQNNAGPGFRLDGCSAVTLTAASAESNWAGTVVDGPTPGFVLTGCTRCIIVGSSLQSLQGGVQIGRQANAVALTDGADSNTLVLSHFGSGPAMTDSSVLLGNRVTVNGSGA